VDEAPRVGLTRGRAEKKVAEFAGEWLDETVSDREAKVEIAPLDFEQEGVRAVKAWTNGQSHQPALFHHRGTPRCVWRG
jgi:hypothetical protein